MIFDASGVNRLLAPGRPSRWYFALLGLLFFAFSAPLAAGTWQQSQSLGGFNDVNVYTPDSVSPVGNGRGLLLVLHGCTQAIDAYLTANLEDAADAHGLVIAVPDAMNKAGFSCWSYWQGTISRTSGDYANLVGLVGALLADASIGIDPDQVYITGLSSGATFAAQAACVAPDLFAGVAPSAGPTIGTSSNGAIGTCETVSPAQFESRCRSYAPASVEGFLDTQVAVVAQGTNDTTVSTCYNQQNANGYAQVYGVSQLSGSNTIVEGPGTAQETLWQNGRVAMLDFEGLDHVWSGGSGASGSFIGGGSINFATYLGAFFAANNPRIDRNEAPVVSNLSVTVSADKLAVSGTASDADGSVANVEIAISNIDGTPVLVEIIDTDVDGSNRFDATSGPLPDALYEVSVVATDDAAAESDARRITRRIGNPPPDQPPVISELQANIDAQCATITGLASDANQDLVSVDIEFEAGGTLIGANQAMIDGSDFVASRCNLPGETVTATATATDAASLSSSDSVTFQIDAGKTGDFNFHIGEGHITWGNGYAECYLEFGTSEFIMRESSVDGDQCIWTADGAPSCQGPVQTCRGPGSGGDPEPDPDPAPEPSPDPDPECSEFTTMNYLHRSAGRAYSTGNFWAPDYFAEGSDQPMPGSTYGNNTLSSSDGIVWSLGGCGS